MLELWPFTNFHDLNLDWIIKVVKHAEDVVTNWEKTLKSTVEAILADHPEYIQNWMLEDGSVTNEKLAEEVGDCWVDEIEMETFRDDQTDRYVASIPAFTTQADVILPIMGAEHTPITPAIYARQIGSTFTGNMGCAILTTSDTYCGGAIINAGEIVENESVTGNTLADNDTGYIAIKADRTWKTYAITTDPNDIIADGYEYASPYWFKLVQNFTAVDLSSTNAGKPAENIIAGHHPRSAIGFRADNSIVYYACGGRTPDQKGMTAAEVANEMVRLGCRAAYMMDGGGSTSFSYKCAKLNPNIDSDGTYDRMVRGSINFVKPDCNNFMADAFAFTGQIRQLTMTQTRRFINYWRDYFTSNLNPLQTTGDPQDISLNNQALAVKAFMIREDSNPYDYNTFLSLKAGASRWLFRMTTGNELSYSLYVNGAWYGWYGHLPISLGHGQLYPGTVPANGTLPFSVTLPRTAPDSAYTPTVTLIYGNDCIAWVTSVTTTGFSGYIENLSSADKSPGLRWQAIWTK